MRKTGFIFPGALIGAAYRSAQEKDRRNRIRAALRGGIEGEVAGIGGAFGGLGGWQGTKKLLSAIEGYSGELPDWARYGLQGGGAMAGWGLGTYGGLQAGRDFGNWFAPNLKDNETEKDASMTNKEAFIPAATGAIYRSLQEKKKKNRLRAAIRGALEGEGLGTGAVLGGLTGLIGSRAILGNAASDPSVAAAVLGGAGLGGYTGLHAGRGLGGWLAPNPDDTETEKPTKKEGFTVKKKASMSGQATLGGAPLSPPKRMQVPNPAQVAHVQKLIEQAKGQFNKLPQAVEGLKEKAIAAPGQAVNALANSEMGKNIGEAATPYIDQPVSRARLGMRNPTLAGMTGFSPALQSFLGKHPTLASSILPLLGGGAVLGGAYGLHKLMGGGKKRREEDEEKEAACDAALCHINNLCASLPLEKQARFRLVQANISEGYNLLSSIKAAFPNATETQRMKLASVIVKGASKLYPEMKKVAMIKSAMAARERESDLVKFAGPLGSMVSFARRASAPISGAGSGVPGHKSLAGLGQSASNMLSANPNFAANRGLGGLAGNQLLNAAQQSSSAVSGLPGNMLQRATGPGLGSMASRVITNPRISNDQLRSVMGNKATQRGMVPPGTFGP